MKAGRAAAIVLVPVALCFVVGVGCGEESAASEREFPGTTLTVEVFPLPIMEALDYSVTCGDVTAEGSFESVGVGSDPSVPSTVWRAVLDLPAGPCTGFWTPVSAGGSGWCYAIEQFEVAADAPTQVYSLVTECGTGLDFPGGELILTAETQELEELAEVRYRVTCEGSPKDPDAEPYMYDDDIDIAGELEVVGESTADLGFGRVPTLVWQLELGELPERPCRAVVSAHDSDEMLLCSAEHDFESIVDVTTRVLVVLPCAPSDAGQ